MARHRSAFRRLISVPDVAGGSAWLRQALKDEPGSLKVPELTRMVLLDVPFVIARGGAIVPLPITPLIEERIAPPANRAGAENLADLPFVVLEGRRPLLLAPGRTGGGMERLDPDHPFPHGGSCVPDPGVLFPVSTTCLLCHGQRGDSLFGNMSHGPQVFRAVDDAQLLIRRGLAEKQRRPDFTALHRYFSPGLSPASPHRH